MMAISAMSERPGAAHDLDPSDPTDAITDYADYALITVMGWTAPRPASKCAKMRCQTHLREAVHEKVYQEFVRCHDYRARYREECVPGSRRRRRWFCGGGQVGAA